ncbi:MAG: CBS domain-containing protein [Xanthobacteraceae bacterium]|nr:CBS domain-containing protein [Xanthobacteraceae bacterium]
MYRFIEQTVDRYMTREVRTVSRDLAMGALNDLFAADDFNAYPVVDRNAVIGVVSKFDFLKCFSLTQSSILPPYGELMKRTVADVMVHEFIYVNAATRLARVLQLMVEHRLRSIPVLGEGHRLVGIISREDVMRALRDSTGPVAT